MKNYKRMFRRVVAAGIASGVDAITKSDELLERKDWAGLRDMISTNELTDEATINNIIDIMIMRFRVKPLVFLVVNNKIKDVLKINKILDLSIDAGEWSSVFEMLKEGKVADAERISEALSGLFANEYNKEIKELSHIARYKELIKKLLDEAEFSAEESFDNEDAEMGGSDDFDDGDDGGDEMDFDFDLGGDSDLGGGDDEMDLDLSLD